MKDCSYVWEKIDYFITCFDILSEDNQPIDHFHVMLLPSEITKENGKQLPYWCTTK